MEGKTISDLLINEQIRDKEVRVIGEDGEQLGIMKISDLKEAIDIVIGDADFKGDVFKLLDSTDEVIYFDDILAKQNSMIKNEVL